MTSSKYLRSGFRKSLAFPIMLAAVGLLLASLVLGQGTNLARALGENNAGICGYSDLMRNAILANNGQTDTNYDCDDEYVSTATATFWGGAKTVADGNGPKDLDLRNKGISTFEPGKGELDGFINGSRVDLRGNGLTTADLDVSSALESWEVRADGTNASKFGDSVNGEGDGTPAGTPERTAPAPGLTFLLDGGSTSSNGLASASYSVTEGGIAWITFEYGNKHADFAKVNENAGGVWARVVFTIEHDRATGDESSDVSILINSKDPDGVLYAVPFKFPNDIVIEKDEDFDIENLRLVSVGTFEEAAGTTVTPSTVFTADEFADSLVRDGDEAEITVIDNDTPPVLVSDRDDDVSDAISELFTRVNGGTSKSKKKMSIGDLERLTNTDDTSISAIATGGELAIGKTNTAANNGEPISSITPADLAGLTKLNKLDLSDNDLTELPSGLFAEVGSKGKADLSTEIILKGNDGPTGDGFFLSNLGPVGEELVAGQYLVVDTPKDDKSASGFLDATYEGVEGGVLVFNVNIKTADDTATAGIQFLSTTGDTGALAGNDDTDKDVENPTINLGRLGVGQYRIAIGLPENKKESSDNTLTALFGHAASGTANDATITNLEMVLSVAPITIRDKSYEAPAEAPAAPESSFESVVVTQNEFVEAPGNEDLKHNISNFTVTIGGEAVSANFLDVYNATGGLERWGYPTSEVVEIPGIGLTQFFQRGALHLESNAQVTRLLAWDYVGGGKGGSTDQGVEAAPDAGPEGGEQIGAFDHYVANVDADGAATGFLDFFNRLGGVAAFGFPKTEARADTGDEGTLMEPGTTAGFTRQYFQAAVFQLAEDGTVELTLLGDTLRGILVPNFADIDAFGAAAALSVGDEVSPPVIDS